MDLAIITEFINSTGFPICACVALFYLVRDQAKNNANMVRSFKDAIDSNTKAIDNLRDEVKK